MGKSGKTESEELDLRSLNKRTKYIKIILLVSLALTVVVGIIFTAIFYTQRHEDTADDDVPSDPGDNEDNNIGNHQILDRTQWNGRPPIRIRNITAPVPLVVIKHTGGGTCTTFRVCAGKLQTIQSQAVGDGADDIYYNFLIGGDENIYVGRGWDVQPAQRDNIIDIVFMGSFTFDVPTAGMIEAAKLLIEDGAQKGKLTDDYKVVCHSQTETTESPGLHLIEEVKTWPHYDPGSYRSRSLVR
ncbi:hypothetical protein NQ318_009688 [Aromia moschata]|uniref:Uncharacterized protein n=1 Tax=Aromia moschata TaxID=1265417 RepID=A0AAV8X7C0_9CUCU|nr:hypothetical protein NQ318_009688 [Aromia moschata]